jgi:hypothetical protein
MRFQASVIAAGRVCRRDMAGPGAIRSTANFFAHRRNDPSRRFVEGKTEFHDNRVL